MIGIEAVRARNDRVKAEFSLLIQPERAAIQTSADIDALLAEVERLRADAIAARDLLWRILLDDRLDLSDGTMDGLGDFLGASALSTNLSSAEMFARWKREGCPI